MNKNRNAFSWKAEGSLKWVAVAATDRRWVGDGLGFGFWG